MAANTKELVARLRFETDRSAARRTKGEIKSLDKAVTDLGESADKSSDLLERVKASTVPGAADAGEAGRLSFKAIDRLTQVGEALGSFEMALDDLGVELSSTGEKMSHAPQNDDA